MAYKIKCYIKRPDEEYGHSTSVSNTLENLQRNVGGYIETVTLVLVVCDEEGLIKGKPYNCHYAGIGFYGDILILGCKDEDFCDVPIGWDMHKKMVEP